MSINTINIRDMKRRRKPIVAITAYDHTFAQLADRAGAHMLLIGDSLGMVIQGHETTLPVTLDEMIYHSRIVARATQNAMVVADMPFMSFQLSSDQAMSSAGRLMKEALVDAVKLEGGKQIAPAVRRLTQAGIPVVGHIGLTPQSVHQLGGYKVQGKTLGAARRLIADGEALDEAGAFAIVLETIPAQLARVITERVSAATIGIGAGSDCDGQIQVMHDVLGLLSELNPRHAKKYVDLVQIIGNALTKYRNEVSDRNFPGPEHSVSLNSEYEDALVEEFGSATPIGNWHK